MTSSAKSDNDPLKRSQSDLADFGARLSQALGTRSQKWLAEEAGVSPQMISDYVKNGKVPGSDKAVLIADALDVDLTWLLKGVGTPRPVYSEVRGAGAVGFGEVEQLFYGEKDLPRLPLYGSAVGGEYGDVEEHIELIELDLSEALDYLPRPLSLADDPNAYALTIEGRSMVPRFRPGERVAVTPRAQISIGDDVIVQLKSGRDDDDRVQMVLVKELVRRTAAEIELHQHNPDITFRVPNRRVARMHKIKGHYL